MPESLDRFLNALLEMDRVAARRALDGACAGDDRLAVVEHLIVPALERIGERWERGEVSLAQVYMSGRICEQLVETILPLCEHPRIDQPGMAIAVLDDHHLLGKRIVYSVLRASGYALRDYGSIDGTTLVERVLADRIEVLLISVLMLPSALRIKEVRSEFDRQGYRPLILVGGAPFRFDPELWREVGADAMAGTAAEGVAILDRLIRCRASGTES